MSLFTPLLVPLVAACCADGPSDNVAANARPIPKPGIAVPDETKNELEKGLADLLAKVDQIKAKNDAKLLSYLPDILIYSKAVDYALTGHEFFDKSEFSKAKELLSEGLDRAAAILERGKAPWRSKAGLVVLGYISKIDGSVQPYGLVVPESYDPKGAHRHRLDLWFHGRGELLSEVNFLDERRKRAGEFAPEDAIVLHPYGRFCNAAKLAGEIDALEAMEDVKAKYKIDPDRISVRGFSMGGASAWHFAVHYPDHWFAANPGAGFSETPRFLRVFQNEKLEPAWYEQTLWRLYDCDLWAGNLSGCPTVAYSGELDAQKQAADVMAEALQKLGIRLTHVIGPKTKHQYEKGAKAIVSRKMDELAKLGRPYRPKYIDLTTYTLRYPRMYWLTIEAMDQHWEPANVQAKLAIERHAVMFIKEENVSSFRIDVPSGTIPVEPRTRGIVIFEGGGGKDNRRDLAVTSPETDGSWTFSMHKEGDRWLEGPAQDTGLRKIHGLQGPIDDAFLDSFLFVRPTSTSQNSKVEAWVKSEYQRAIRRWRTQMRGDARVKDDNQVSDSDIANSNLILWGDPSSNSVLAKVADKLPIRWEGDQIIVGDRKFAAANHAPILIYPNPLNPKKYIVLNSGFTYREYDDLNNARQVPKLPDWAIVNVDTPPDSRYPGKIADADFFDDAWKLKSPHRTE